MMTDQVSNDPLGGAVRLYFSFRDQAADRMVQYKAEEKVFIKNLASSGVTAAEAHIATTDFKKMSINYAGVRESLGLAEDAMKTARDLYDLEVLTAAVDATADLSLTEINWSDVTGLSSPEAFDEEDKAWQLKERLPEKP